MIDTSKPQAWRELPNSRALDVPTITRIRLQVEAEAQYANEPIKILGQSPYAHYMAHLWPHLRYPVGGR